MMRLMYPRSMVRQEMVRCLCFGLAGIALAAFGIRLYLAISLTDKSAWGGAAVCAVAFAPCYGAWLAWKRQRWMLSHPLIELSKQGVTWSPRYLSRVFMPWNAIARVERIPLAVSTADAGTIRVTMCDGKVYTICPDLLQCHPDTVVEALRRGLPDDAPKRHEKEEFASVGFP